MEFTNDQGWSKSNLKLGERNAWTRGRDGWTGIGPNEEIRSVIYIQNLKKKKNLFIN
jgi:hypothetical protein